MKKFHVIVICLTFIVLGCATSRMTEVPETMALKQPPQLPAPIIKPEPQKAEELPPVKDIRRFSLSVRDANVRDVFLLLSKDSGVNIIADRDITGKVSIDFSNLELNSSLYAITRQLGYTYKIENGFVRISRAQMVTRTFYVNYVKDIREAKSTTNIAGFSGSENKDQQGTQSTQGMNVSLTTQSTSDFWTALEDGLQIIIFGNVDKQNSLKSRSGFSRGDAVKKDIVDAKGQNVALKSRADMRDTETVGQYEGEYNASKNRTGRRGVESELESAAVRGSYRSKEESSSLAASVESEGEGQLVRSKTFESLTDRKLIVNELAGIVQVTDYAENISNIESFLEDVERAVRKQVMIQAHIIEVALDDSYKFGINWDAVLQLPGNLDLTLSQNLVIPLPTGSSPVFKVDFNHRKVDGILEAMKGQGQVNVLSSPKISTMNNQRAVIKLTTKEVSWVNTRTYITSGGSSLPVDTTTPQIDEIGLFLDVTPQIDNDGIITMQIHPSISEKLSDSTSPDGKSTKPILKVREVDTMIKTRNGQTIVIAGLITDKINDTTTKVPILGDIPLFGNAFKQVIQEKKKSELVILLTPYVLTDQSIEDIRREHESRLRKAGRIFEATPVFPLQGKN